MASLISIDQTGDYDRFLVDLETREGRAKPSQIRFVVDASTSHPVLVPRRMNGKAVHSNLSVDEKAFNVMQRSLDQLYQTIAQLLQQRIQHNGYYVIHGMDQAAYLVPAPKEMSGNLPEEDYKPLGTAIDAPTFQLAPSIPFVTQPEKPSSSVIATPFMVGVGLSMTTLIPLDRCNYGFSTEGTEIQHLTNVQFEIGEVSSEEELLFKSTSPKADRHFLDAIVAAPASELLKPEEIKPESPAAEEVEVEGSGLESPAAENAEDPVISGGKSNNSGKPNNSGGSQGNNGHGNGDQEAPGGSGGHNNSENAAF